MLSTALIWTLPTRLVLLESFAFSSKKHVIYGPKLKLYTRIGPKKKKLEGFIPGEESE